MSHVRWCGLAALAAAVLSWGATAGAQMPPVVQARVDIDGTKDGVQLFVVTPPAGGTGSTANWYAAPDEAKNKQYLTFQAPSHASDWREMRFSFMALRSGTVRIALRGPWFKPAEEIVKVWVMFDDVSVENSTLLNGGFEDATAAGPAPWVLGKRDGFLAVHHLDGTYARAGKGCIEVCHDLDGSQFIPVQANQTVTVRAWHRRGE